MRFWREIAADRSSGGILCLALVLMFVAQIALAGRAGAAMVAPDPLSIICTSAPEGFHRPADTDHRPECPGAVLCGAGLHLQATLSPSDETGIRVQFATRIERAPDRTAVASGGTVVRWNHARGPPTTPSTAR